MKNFHNVNLPNYLALHATGSPIFATTIATTASGREVRQAARAHAMQIYTIKDCRLSAAQFEEFNGFFRARLGQQFSFCMRDYADCIIKDQMIGGGGGISFKVIKIYPDTLNPYNRRVTKLVAGTVELKINDLDAGGLEIDHKRGTVTLAQPLGVNERLTINALFDVEVRFNSDNFKYSMHADGSIVVDNLELIEVI